MRSFLILIFTFGTVIAQNSDPPKISAVKINEPLRLDGKLDEAVWESAARIDRFIQREPDDGQPVSEKTIVYICYDGDNIYFGIDCRDSEPENIVATEMRRDEILYNNDCIEIYLDTYNDHRSAFCFSTNSLGARRDGIVVTDVSEEEQNWDWNGVWEVKTESNSEGWKAEIMIPFKTLRFKPGTNLVWGMNIARYIPRKREEAFWAPISRDLGFWGHYRVEVFGHLQNLQSLQQPLKWQIKPFALTGVQRDFIEEDEYDKKLDFGLDAQYLITPNLTATITLNTDFAQVEADQEQINLTRFELFLPEKREFFLEAANIFNIGERSFSPMVPPNSLFFSRRIGLSDDNEIVPLIGGVKMTGKEGGLNIGFLDIVADKISYVNSDDDSVDIPRTNYTVARLKQDIFTNSSIGVIGLNKQSIDGHGYTRNFALDANFYLTSNAQMSGFLAQSFEPSVSKNNYAGYLDFSYRDDLFNISASQNSIQENFNAEMGFFPRTNARKSQLNFGISPRPGILKIRQIYLFNDFIYITDQQSRLETRTNLTGFFSLFNNGSALLGVYLQNYERLIEEFEIHDDIIIPIDTYRFDRVFLMYRSDLSKPIAGSIQFESGNFFSGTLTGYGVQIFFKFGKRLTVNMEYQYNDVKLTTGDFKTTLIISRIIYSFSPDLFLKPFIQYNSDTNLITSNFLLNFIHTPGSDLYFVYNEELDLSGSKVRTENRTILLKLTYLFGL